MNTCEPRRTRGWWIIGGFVVAHNIWAAGRGREMLSEAADRGMASRPWLVRSAVALVALHIVNGIPSRFDPCHQAFSAGARLSEKLQGGGRHL